MPMFQSGWMRLLAVGTGLAAVTLAGAALGFYLAFVRDLPDLRSVDDYRPPVTSRVTDRSGRLIGEFFAERRRLTPQGLDSVASCPYADSRTRGRRADRPRLCWRPREDSNL